MSGILFWYPLAGVTYQFLHYLIGLRRIGYDVYYVEDSARHVYDPRINDFSPDASGNVETIAPVLRAHGFEGRWAFREHHPQGRCYGLTERELLSLYREAEAFLNVTGAQELRDEHMQIPRRIYVESDPFACQVKVAQGDQPTIEALTSHHTIFSFGENLGAEDCDVPVERFRWLPTRQPVVLDMWEGLPGTGGEAYTTVTTWHNKGKELAYRGETYYWTKDREFEKFLVIPRFRTVPLEIALGRDEGVEGMLRDHGWRPADSLPISRDLDRYRSYIQGSRGEFTVARDQYVRPRTGWFSDRSACYLAAGRPVITQETGFSKFLPVGKGLFAFTTVEDVLRALDTIESDYPGNCVAAREIAAEYFDAEKVIASLMERAGA